MSDPRYKRLFLAVDLPTTVKAELLALQHPAPHIKWMNPDQFHITLYFLGQTHTQNLEDTKAIVKKVADNLPTIPLKLSAVDAEKGRMIWVRVDDPSGQLETMYNQLKKEFARARIGEKPRPRPLSPHVLLGKYKDHLMAEDEPVLVQAKQTFKVTPLEIDAVSLYESELRPEGAKHTILAEFSLSKHDQG